MMLGMNSFMLRVTVHSLLASPAGFHVAQLRTGLEQQPKGREEQFAFSLANRQRPAPLHGDLLKRIQGKELVRVQAERDYNKLVKHDEVSTIMNDRTRVVHRDENVTIGQNRQKTVKANETVTIGKNLMKTVQANEREVTAINRSVVVGVSRAR